MSRRHVPTSTCVFRVRMAGFCAPGYGPSIWRERDRASEYARPTDPLDPTGSRPERGADSLRVDHAPAKKEFLFLLDDDDE